MSSFFSDSPPPPPSSTKPPWTITTPDDERLGDADKLTPREAARRMREKAGDDLSPRSAQDGKNMALQTLIEEWLDLEYIDRNLYRSRHLWLPLGARGVFGGQVIGQSLVAMSRTVASGFTVHSLHCYFVLPGNPAVPILYSVDRIRDGASFCTRRVRASQGDRTIFVSSASFQRTAKTKPDVPGTVVLEYQSNMPKVPMPEELPTSTEQIQKALEGRDDIPKHLHSLLTQRMQEPVPFEFKPVGRDTLSITATQKVIPPRQLVWIRARGKLDPDPALHQAVLAHASDHYLVNTALLAHGVSFNTQPRLKLLASLDHSMWFHIPGYNGITGFRADDWLLYELESNRTSANRGLVFGRVWTRDGKLAVTVAQEGVMRVGYDVPVEAKAPPELANPPSDEETGKEAPAPTMETSRKVSQQDSDIPPEYRASETRHVVAPRNDESDGDMPPEYLSTDLSPELKSQGSRQSSHAFDGEDEMSWQFGGQDEGFSGRGRDSGGDGVDADMDLEMGLMEWASNLMDEEEEAGEVPKSKL